MFGQKECLVNDHNVIRKVINTMTNQSSGIDEAYSDRNQAAMLAAKLATLWGFEVGWRTDPSEPDWPVLFIELPTGQVSWHIPKSETVKTDLSYKREWDGHTVEEKRERIARFIE